MTARDDATATVAARLRALRFVDNDALGAALLRAAACLEPQADGSTPGWLFDEYTDPALAVRLCARCPVRDECTELELRLAGGRTVGMWGAYGEGGRQALYRVWRAGGLADGDGNDTVAHATDGEIGGR